MKQYYCQRCGLRFTPKNPKERNGCLTCMIAYYQDRIIELKGIIAPLSSQKFGTSSKNEEVKED